MSTPKLLVTVSVDPDQRTVIESAVPDSVAVTFLADVEDRTTAITAADALLVRLPHQELTDEELGRLGPGQVMQAVSSGVDHLPLDRLPAGVVLQNNAGAQAEPIAEHVLALYLALCKRLRIEHLKLQQGEFDQRRPNRRVDGTTCTVFGFGGIGRASARLLQTVGVSILAINRSGETSASTEFVGTPDDLETALGRSDGLVIAAPLTPETRGVIDRETLEWLPDDGILINIARGELVVQDDLYDHLQAHPEFQAGIDAWWKEPVRHGEFAIDHPFLDLPNVIGSPHNSAQQPDIAEHSLRAAANRVGTTLVTGERTNVVDRELGY